MAASLFTVVLPSDLTFSSRPFEAPCPRGLVDDRRCHIPPGRREDALPRGRPVDLDELGPARDQGIGHRKVPATDDTEDVPGAEFGEELTDDFGNQHWPALVKGTRVFVPLTVDRKVMASVMNTHRFENIRYEFVPGADIIPYLAPHESRRLFGGAEGPVHSHVYDHAQPQGRAPITRP